MDKIVLTRDDSLELLDCDSAEVMIDGNVRKFEKIYDEVSSTGRWSEYHDIVIKDTDSGEMYISDYSVGLTECQEESPWEFEDNVEWVRCEPYEVKITKYRVIK